MSVLMVGAYLDVFFRAARISHWVKNLLLFMPLLSFSFWFDGAKLNASASHQILDLIMAFFGISLFHSSCYMINDAMDVFRDRLHPIKRFRPLASGEISGSKNTFLAVLLIICSLVVSMFIPQIIAYYIVYMFIFAIYSTVAKFIFIVDVLLLSAFYCLRVILGFHLVGLEVSTSQIIVVFSILFALSSIKRQKEFEISSDFRFSKYSVLFKTGMYLKIIQLISVTLIVYASVLLQCVNNPETNIGLMTAILALVSITLSLVTLRWVFISSYESDDISKEIFNNKNIIVSFFVIQLIMVNL